MKNLINHDEAIELEYIIRRVYKCDRFGVMGIANADRLEHHPLDAANVILAPLYFDKSDLTDVENFMDTYSSLFNFYDYYEYDKDKVRSYIDGLKKLVDKYY